MRTHFCALLAITLAWLTIPSPAQEVSIPDPGLNAAIRDALHKPVGPLTEQDLLTLTNLNARRLNVSSIVGLEAARNLVSLNLEINSLTNISFPSGLSNLDSLDLSANPLTNFFLPVGTTNLSTLILESAGLTNLTLPSDLTRLTNLDLFGNEFISFDALSNLTTLVFLDLSFNSFTNFSVPGGLTNLNTLRLGGNPLTNLTLPSDLGALTDLYLAENELPSFSLPPGLTNLEEIDLSFNQLTDLSLPDDLKHLSLLNLDFNRFSRLNLPTNLVALGALHLRANQFTNLVVPAEFTGMKYLDISANPLTNISIPGTLQQLATLRLSENRLGAFTLPAGLTNLAGINLSSNLLTSLVLPPDLNRLETLNLSGNQLTSLNLPSGLTNLAGLFFVSNQITNLTVLPDMTQLSDLGFLANPLTSFVLPETIAATTNLVDEIAALESQGIPVYTYPLAVQLIRLRQPIGAFQFGIEGPPGAYSVLSSTDLASWSEFAFITNFVGKVVFTDSQAHLSNQKFYRVRPQVTPTNMVFIPAGTFVIGSPPDEVGRGSDEGPQTTVTISHGFWMGIYEVTQADYLRVVGSNPSQFPGDLSRPVESVSWLDATNYCALLTARERSAGFIPPGTRYRLPTEAEWEYAARAGSTTRFSYGDDPSATNLVNFAWYSANSLSTQPVGQKLPNPSGLYDMEGNVWEWCSDWQGSYPGGAVTDPLGPDSNLQGKKIVRGGAWDGFVSDCRSAKRMAFGASPFITDSTLGFRVVLTAVGQ